MPWDLGKEMKQEFTFSFVEIYLKTLKRAGVLTVSKVHRNTTTISIVPSWATCIPFNEL